MKKGSLVVCIDDKKTPLHEKFDVIIPVKGKCYIVRETIDPKETATGEMGVYLEEILNKEILCQVANGTKIMEPAYKESRFEEIETDISEILEILNRPTLVPVE